MLKTKAEVTVKKFQQMMEKGTMSFDYPIQRAGGQWDLLQKSTLIHSLIEDFPVPSLYSITDEDENEKGRKVKVKQILDGKQRLTNIYDFIKGEYVLHADTPTTTYEDEEYILADRSFDELPQELKDAILDYSLTIYDLQQATDEQIEEIFFRLNNGTQLSKQQKAKAKMGREWAGKIKSLIEHPLMTEKASFTELQKRKADDEMAILQTMMLLDDSYEFKSISSNDVFEYAQTLKNNSDKDVIIEQVELAMDYLNQAFEEKETVMLKKVHFPMTILTALEALEKGIHPLRFSDWKEEFKKALKRKSDITTEYKRYGGAGSVKKEKTLGRVSEMSKHMNEYFKDYIPANDTIDTDDNTSTPSILADEVNESQEISENVETEIETEVGDETEVEAETLETVEK